MLIYACLIKKNGTLVVCYLFMCVSYFLISFILHWSFCKVVIIVLKDATFRFA